MNVEMFTDLLNTYLFLRRITACEYQLRETCGNETQLDEPIDAFARFQAVGIETEVLFGISRRSEPVRHTFSSAQLLRRLNNF